MALDTTMAAILGHISKLSQRRRYDSRSHSPDSTFLQSAWAEFYCGDKRRHVMLSQVILDAGSLMLRGMVLVFH